MQSLRIACSKNVVTTAIKVALVVGTVLALINHLPALLENNMTQQNIWQIVLTYLVPYSVSTYSAVAAINATRETAGTADSR